jgi:hypothetical protein
MNNNKRKNNKKGKKNNRSKYRIDTDNQVTSVQKPLYGFIYPRVLTTLKYTDQITRINLTLVGSNYIYNMNSVFDPDVTGTGHQPYGHDTLAGIYARYRVMRIRWKIVNSANNSAHLLVVPTNGALSTPITNQATFSAACEVPYSSNKMIGFLGTPCVTFSGEVALNQLGGATLVQYKADDRFQAVFGASPGELILLNLGFYNPNTTTVTLIQNIEIWYELEAFDPIIQAQS